ncbi:hypothetical protein [Luteitalea sp.]|uniref:hypothetical protein n=1 Tax=Luteitalea sp. TaxID=2004800 RepID=UPI0025BF7B99|nr:hypothetical protein [Luteitalea sp.]
MAGVQRATLAVAMALLAAPIVIRAQEPGATQAPRADNYYAAGPRVEISTPMDADVVVAGRTVVIGKSVGGDILAAGWDVTLAAPAHDDVRIAGGTVAIDAPVAGDLTIAGREVTTGGGTHVQGRAWITGETVRVLGTFDRTLAVAARSVHIGGEVREPLQVVAEELEILPTARLLAPVTYRGVTTATIAAGAVLTSPLAFERIEPRDARDARAWPTVSTLLFVAHLLIVGLLALYLVPTFEPSIVQTLRRQPGRSLLAGFTLLITLPVAALLLMFTVLGFPLGVALVMCYAMALFGAVLATAFFVGDLEARLFSAGPVTTKRQQAMLLLAGVVTLAALRLVLGGVVVFVSALFGLGALALWLYQLRGHGPALTTA